MADHFLVFADPPHPSPDVKAISDVIGVLPVEARGKLGYPFPEPWLGLGDPGEARSAAERLTAAGVRVAIVRAAELASVPEADAVREFSCSDDGLEWSTRGGKTRGSLLWKDVRVALSYRRLIEVETHDPGGGGQKPRGLGAAKFMANMVVPVVGGAIVGKLAGSGGAKSAPRSDTHSEDSIEVAGVGPDGPRRARFTKTDLSFVGLGARIQPAAQANWMKLLAIVGEHVTFDRRGEKGRARPTLVKGVGLKKTFEAESKRLREIGADPCELFAAFACWQKDVRS
jgi:hypothetical protein